MLPGAGVKLKADESPPRLLEVAAAIIGEPNVSAEASDDCRAGAGETDATVPESLLRHFHLAVEPIEIEWGVARNLGAVTGEERVRALDREMGDATATAEVDMPEVEDDSFGQAEIMGDRAFEREVYRSGVMNLRLGGAKAGEGTGEPSNGIGRSMGIRDPNHSAT